MNAVKEVSITTMPISTPAENAFECAVRDRVLINSICKYADMLRGQGVEVYKRKDNVIATSTGYYFAWYDEDLRSVEGGIDNPTPFKGKDGRMKVSIVKENGTISIEDLAILIAMRFCPNPKKYTKVYFKDFDVTNCNADNLQWVSYIKYCYLRIIKFIGLK